MRGFSEIPKNTVPSEEIKDTRMSRRELLLGTAAFAGSYFIGGTPRSIALAAEKSEQTAEERKEKLIDDFYEEFSNWFNSAEGQQAYERGNLQAILERLAVIPGDTFKGTRYDPLKHYTSPPTFPIDPLTGDISEKGKCNSFTIDTRGSVMLGAAHCIKYLRRSIHAADVHTDEVADIGSYVLRGEQQVDGRTVDYNPDLSDEDVHGKIVVGIAYDKLDSFSNYKDTQHGNRMGIKLYGGIAIQINESLADTIIELWRGRGENYEGWREEMVGDFFYMSNARRENAAGGTSGAPIMLEGETLCGVTTATKQIPSAEADTFKKSTGNGKDDWVIAHFPGPDKIRHFLEQSE